MTHCSHIHCPAPKIIQFLLIDLFLRPLPSSSQLLMSGPWSWLKFKSDCTFFIISLRLWNSLTLSIRSASTISEGCVRVFDYLFKRLRCQYSNTEIIILVFVMPWVRVKSVRKQEKSKSWIFNAESSTVGVFRLYWTQGLSWDLKNYFIKNYFNACRSRYEVKLIKSFKLY